MFRMLNNIISLVKYVILWQYQVLLNELLYLNVVYRIIQSGVNHGVNWR